MKSPAARLDTPCRRVYPEVSSKLKAPSPSTTNIATLAVEAVALLSTVNTLVAVSYVPVRV